MHRAACLDEGFRAEGLRGEPTHWVPWDRVELICAGRIAREDEYRNVYAPRWPSAVVSGFRALVLMKPQPASRRARATRIPRDPIGEVIIVRRDPRIAFRVVENQMNYAYLGRRLSQSAAENFPVFVADLCARADAAYLTPSTRSLLGGGDPAEHEFPSSQALLDYATHRLLWSWYRRDREAQAGGVPGRGLGHQRRHGDLRRGRRHRRRARRSRLAVVDDAMRERGNGASSHPPIVLLNSEPRPGFGGPEPGGGATARAGPAQSPVSIG